MNRFFSIFCSLGVFLVLSILAACDSGSSGGGDGDKSSSSRYTPPQSSPQGNGSIDITNWEVSQDPRYLDIKLSVRARENEAGDSILTKAEITVNGTVIASGPGKSFYNYDDQWDFTGRQFCDPPQNGEVHVCYTVILGSPESEKGECKSFTRPESICNIPSSSSEEQSSSSAIPVVSKTLTPMFNGEAVKINTVTGYKGINLRAGEATSNLSDADFYINSEEDLVAKSGVNIVENFDRTQYGSSGFNVIKDNWVSTPNNTNQFIFKPNDPGEPTINYVYTQYYMVRLSNTTEWNSDCFLIYGAAPFMQQGANNQNVEIKVWKVVD